MKMTGQLRASVVFRLVKDHLEHSDIFIMANANAEWIANSLILFLSCVEVHITSATGICLFF
jgi:hypothetical protein